MKRHRPPIRATGAPLNPVFIMKVVRLVVGFLSQPEIFEAVRSR